MRKYLILLLLALFYGNGFCQTITLKNGNVIKGEIINTSDEFVEIKTSFGKFKFTRGEIEAIDYDVYLIKLKEGTVLKAEVLEKTDVYIKIIFSGNEVKIPRQDILSMEPVKTDAGPSSQKQLTSQPPQSDTHTLAADKTAIGLGSVSASAAAATISGRPMSQSASQSPGVSALSPAMPAKASDYGAAPSAASENLAVIDLAPAGAAVEPLDEDYSRMKYVITLKNGRQIAATILDMDEESIHVASEAGRQTLLMTSILSIVAQTQTFTPEPQASYTPTHIVTLKSGSKIECEMVGETPTKIKMVTEYGLTEISKNGVLSIEKIKETKETKSEEKEDKKEKERKEKFNKKFQDRFQKKEPARELSVIIGLWKPPFKLDMSEEGGPDSVSLQDNAITYGLRYMFYRYGNFYIGIGGAMQAIAKKDLEFAGKTAKISGEAGYLQLMASLPANSNKPDGFYLVAGAGFGITRLNYRVDDDTTSISTIQPIFSFGAGLSKQTKSAILGLETQWSYTKQKDDKLSKSGSGFLSVLGKLSWRFD